MRDIHKRRKTLFCFALIASIGIPGGIIATVLGATHELYAVMGVGIGVLAVCFYATPVLWLMYGAAVTDCRIVAAIRHDGLRSTEQLGNLFGSSSDAMQKKVDALIRKGHLAYAEFYGEQQAPPVPEQERMQCPNCGAPLMRTDKGRVCDYCGYAK